MKYKLKIRFKSNNENRKYQNLLLRTLRSTLRMAQKSLRKEYGDLEIKIQTEERKLKEAHTNIIWS